jgi:hypothetical protein
MEYQIMSTLIPTTPAPSSPDGPMMDDGRFATSKLLIHSLLNEIKNFSNFVLHHTNHINP